MYTQVTKSTVTEFFTDYEKGLSGIIKNGKKLKKNTFAMLPKALIEAEEFTGYSVHVVREIDQKQR